MIALTLSPCFRSRAFALAFVIEATTGVPPARRISTSLFTAPGSSLVTSPASTFRALSFAFSTPLPIITSEALMMANAGPSFLSSRESTL